MATAAPTQNLPLFYNAIEPLNVTQHGKMKVRTVLRMGQVGRTHAIPLTVDEFTLVQRHYPIVFSVGDNPIPIALMGLNEGVNVFLDQDTSMTPGYQELADKKLSWTFSAGLLGRFNLGN